MAENGEQITQGSRARRWAPGVLGLWLLTGLYVVRPEEQAVVRLFGEVIAGRVPPGLHWRAPWPLTRLNKVRASEARRVSVGFELADETTGRQPEPRLVQFVTGDENILSLQLVVQYCVDDPAKYLFRAEGLDRLVAAAAEAALTRTVQDHRVDEVLTEERAELQERTRQEVTRRLATYDVGVRLVSLSITTAFPPAEVSDAFKAVASARGDRDRIIDEARAYENEAIAKAQGEATALVQQAEAYGRRVVAEAEGDAARFRKLWAEYRRARKVTRARLYVEAMEDLLPKMKVIVADSAGGRRPLDLGMLRGSQPTEAEAPGAAGQ